MIVQEQPDQGSQEEDRGRKRPESEEFMACPFRQHGEHGFEDEACQEGRVPMRDPGRPQVVQIGPEGETWQTGGYP